MFISHSDICNKIKTHFSVKGMKSLSLKEIINIGTVSSKEIQSHRMVMFHRLAHIDNIHFTFVIEEIVFREISMYESTHLIHPSHDEKNISISLLQINNFSILKSRGTHSIFTNKLHYNNIVLEKVGSWGFN